MSKHKETLTFNSFSGYYGAVPDGYGGLDWTDIEYLNVQRDLGAADHGFHQVIKGHGEACLAPAEGGLFETANPAETFSLKSMLAESGASTGDPVLFVSYVYSHGSLVRKAADFVYVTPGVEKIDFGRLGGKGDFQNIVAVSMRVGSAAYGPHYAHETIGNGLVFDNLRLEWDSKPASRPDTGHATHASLHSALAGHGSDIDFAASVSGSRLVPAFPDAAPDHSSPSGELSHFALPPPEHFGP
ncbi:MAG TPA: hypothetical protein VHU23_03235 [Rhizomicrobium sp.]|jgi:hypothetical protein|nr:hypothetical protein [Rhizomicrobium sp.]